MLRKASRRGQCHARPVIHHSWNTIKCKFTLMVGLSCLNVSRCLCHTNRPSVVLNRCSMLSCLTPYMSSMDVFDVFPPASSLCTTVFTHDLCSSSFKGWVSRFYSLLVIVNHHPLVSSLVATLPGNVQNGNPIFGTKLSRNCWTKIGQVCRF